MSQIFNETLFDFIYSGFKDGEVKNFTDYSIEEQGQIVEEVSRSKFRGTAPSSELEKKAKSILDADPDVLKKPDESDE